MLPLEGIRVIDLSQVWSGPYATRILGDLGAEVIKVEATRRPDPERGPLRARPGFGSYPNDEPGDQPYNRAARFVEYNRSKYGMTLDLTTTEGLHLLEELVQVSDVVIENFSVGVMDRLGLGYEVLSRWRPDIVMLSMPAFGSTGPEASYVAFGPQQESLNGLAAITGYEEDSPMVCDGVLYPDPTVGLFAASTLLMALWHRQGTGEGQHIELAQREAVLTAIPEIVMEYTMTGRIPRPRGNRHPDHAPHGIYRCLGEDSWVAIAVTNDEEWSAMCAAMGRPELASDPRFSTGNARLKDRQGVDELVEAWTQRSDHYEVMNTLQSAGVAAGAVLNMAELLADPHFAEREFFPEFEHTQIGTLPSLGFPWRFSDTPAYVRMPTPLFGEHSEYILSHLFGVSEEEIRSLEKKDVIGTIPMGAAGRD